MCRVRGGAAGKGYKVEDLHLYRVHQVSVTGEHGTLIQGEGQCNDEEVEVLERVA